MRHKYGEVEGCLPCKVNFVSGEELSSFEGAEPAWKAGTLPPELLPPSYIYSSLKNRLCKGCSVLRKPKIHKSGQLNQD